MDRWERVCPGSEHDADGLDDKRKTTGGQRTAGTTPAMTSGWRTLSVLGRRRARRQQRFEQWRRWRKGGKRTSEVESSKHDVDNDADNDNDDGGGGGGRRAATTTTRTVRG